MSDRRNRPPNRWGCMPTEDVCVAHDMPLECRHGCVHAEPHQCKELDLREKYKEEQ
jgi:hypothetical protein